MNASPNTEKASEVATEKDPRWAAVVARDRGTDGTFFYSVKTTGVYCRPSCASRLAKPENVQFHATCADAEQAGYGQPSPGYQRRRKGLKRVAITAIVTIPCLFSQSL